MKATTIISAAIFALSVNVLFANNDGAAVNNETRSVYTSLAPATPSEATFEELTSAAAAIDLAPVTPVEADFQDAPPAIEADYSILAPATPGEADFSTEETSTSNIMILAPVTPAFADFSETN